MSPFESFVSLLLVNAVGAAALAVVVAIVTRFVRRPAIRHTLWLLVLLKLVTPPLFEVAILPHGFGGEAVAEARPFVPSAAVEVEPAPFSPHVPESAATVLPGFSPANVAIAIWLAGTAFLSLLTVIRAVRFHRLVREARPASLNLTERADTLAGTLDLYPRPPLRLVDGRISPTLWFTMRSLVVLFPGRLLDRLADDERDALLLHELAHARRRDHWVRYLELIVSALFWWHPAVWWARARLREAEESCCDMRVVEALPDQGKSYARGLLKTVEFISVTDLPVPSLASGIGPARKLEERLNMILRNRTPGRLSAAQRVLLAATLPVVLLVLPISADSAAKPADPPKQDAEAAPQSEEARRIREEIHRLELQAIELQAHLTDLERQKARVSGEAIELENRIRIEKIEADIAELEAAGRFEEADVARMKSRQLAERRQYEADRLRLRVEQLELSSPLELQLREALVEAKRLDAVGEYERALALREEALALKHELGRIQFESQLRENERLKEIQLLQQEYLSGDMEAQAREAYESAVARQQHEAELQIERLLMKAAEADAEGLDELAEDYRKKAAQVKAKLAGRNGVR